MGLPPPLRHLHGWIICASNGPVPGVNRPLIGKAPARFERHADDGRCKKQRHGLLHDVSVNLSAGHHNEKFDTVGARATVAIETLARTALLDAGV